MTDDTDAQARRQRFLAMTPAGKAVLAAEDAKARAAQDAAVPSGRRGPLLATDESTERRRRFLEMTPAGRAALAAAAEDAARRGGVGG